LKKAHPEVFRSALAGIGGKARPHRQRMAGSPISPTTIVVLTLPISASRQGHFRLRISPRRIDIDPAIFNPSRPERFFFFSVPSSSIGWIGLSPSPRLEAARMSGKIANGANPGYLCRREGLVRRKCLFASRARGVGQNCRPGISTLDLAARVLKRAIERHFDTSCIGAPRTWLCRITSRISMCIRRPRQIAVRARRTDASDAQSAWTGT